jgi:hypothetical protein
MLLGNCGRGLPKGGLKRIDDQQSKCVATFAERPKRYMAGCGERLLCLITMGAESEMALEVQVR